MHTSTHVQSHAPMFRDRMERHPLLDRGHTVRWILFFASLGATVLATFGLRHQLGRNTLAYRGGLPAKVVTSRTPRPIRSTFEREVRAGEGYEGTLRKMIQPTPGYRMFRRLKP